MTEDRRKSGNPREPGKHGPGEGRRWADYLDWLREDAIAGVCGLADEEQRRSRLPSGWTPVELLSHLEHMEQRWFVWGFLAERVAEPWGDWGVENSAEPPKGALHRWRVSDERPALDIAASLRKVGRRTRAILTSHGLGERAQVGGRFSDDPPTLEWICFHVLVEYARHAGHLDIAGELVPGSRMS